MGISTGLQLPIMREMSHEIHVTVNRIATNPDYFADVCADLGVKAHVIYNEMPNGKTVMDYLTSSEHVGITRGAFQEMGRIATGLKAAGIEVVREKIESSPEHPRAPREPGIAQKQGTYFENHFTLPDLPTTHGWKLLQWKGNPLLISTTDNKRRDGKIFATLRDYDTTSEEFVTSINGLYTALSSHVEVSPPKVEYAVYDSNPDHDKEWVDSYQAQ